MWDPHVIFTRIRAHGWKRTSGNEANVEMVRQAVVQSPINQFGNFLHLQDHFDAHRILCQDIHNFSYKIQTEIMLFHQHKQKPLVFAHWFKVGKIGGRRRCRQETSQDGQMPCSLVKGGKRAATRRQTIHQLKEKYPLRYWKNCLKKFFKVMENMTTHFQAPTGQRGAQLQNVA